MLIGQRKQWQFLRESAKRDRISHAYLFFGPSEIGKKTLALEFVKLLFCQGGKQRPCYICQSCQYLQKGIHPDLFLIEPLKREIQISQIRDLQWRLSLRPFAAPFKAAIIDQAHCLNSEAQSCSLKALEEPKGKAILILITEYPEALFPTILSRVQKIRFSPVSRAEIENYLREKEIPLKTAEKIASLSFGKPGLAINFLNDPQKLKNQDQSIREIVKLSQAELIFRFQYIKDLISQKRNLKEILDIWLRYFREALLSALSSQPPALRQPSQDYSLLRLKNILQTIERINFLISTTNINQRLALEQLMLEL